MFLYPQANRKQAHNFGCLVEDLDTHKVRINVKILEWQVNLFEITVWYENCL